MNGDSMMDRPLKIDRTVNLNTIISGAGLLFMVVGSIVGGTLVYSGIQQQADAWVEFQKRQESYNNSLETSRATSKAAYDTKLETMLQTLNKVTSVVDQFTYQIAQLQKKDDENDARLGRMAESYGNRFTEIQSTLATMSTQLALQNQALTELKQIISPRAPAR